MRATSLRLGQLANQTELSRNVALPQPTVHRYLNLLETSYLLLRLPAYAVNRTKRRRIADAKHLHTFRNEYGDASHAGLLLHAGEQLEWLTPEVLAVPWWRVM